MINYKKSLLSLATVMALSTTSATAGYIPLTGAGANLDKQWVLFGVTGLLSSGTGGGTTEGTFSISDDTKYTIIDSTKDEKFTKGLLVNSAYLGKAKTYTVSYVQVRINTDDFKSKVTEPVHTMYVTMASGSGPAFAVTYDAALEGRTMEYSVSTDGSNAHTITLDSAKTYSNPGFGELIQTAAGTGGSSLSGLTDIVDYDFTNNPPSSSSYSKLTYQSAAEADEYLRVYSYDTANTKWDLFDTRNSDDVNDFSELKKGKAYWGKMNEVGDKQAGLVLGSSSISSLEYQAAGLTDGWNLVSFSAENSTIRKSATGLIVTIEDNAGDIIIMDSSGNHSVTAQNVGTAAGEIETACMNINQAIKQAKINGTLAATFDLKAFPVEATKMVLISNKRFVVNEGAVDTISAITTLTGAKPYEVTVTDLGATDDSAVMDAAVVLHNDAKGALSKYGEYTMIIEPLVGAGTASALEAKIHLQNASSDATDATAQDITTAADADAVATILSATIGGATFVSTGIDTDYDQTTEKVLIASTKPFYVRDYTFTRVFDYTDVTTDSNIRITGAGLDLETPVNGVQTADEFATAINNAANNVKADDVGSKIIIFTSQDNASKFDVTENIETSPYTDQLKDGTTSDPMAKGAVQGVYSLDNYATAAVNTSLVYTVDSADIADDDAALYTITFQTNYGTDYAHTATGITDTDDAVNTANVEEIKTLMEAALSAGGFNGTVTRNGLILTVLSTDVIDFKWTVSVGAEEVEYLDATATKGSLVTVSADLASDLQFNSTYAPNYVNNGPLYIMKDAGFNMKAMVTGTADIDDGSINWESIDLTRKPSEWLASQDYGLFQTDAEAGYWVYLETNADANPLSITATTFSPVYTTHFNVNGTTYNNVAGQIAVEVAGLPQVGDANYDDSAVVEAIVNGSTIELTKKSTNNVYSGDISSYELPILADSDYGINVNIADGLGSNLMNQVSGKTVDMTKPATPVVSVGDGSAVSFTSTSTDVAGYYIFNGQIPDYQTSSATNKLAELTAAEAGSYALCSATGMDQLTDALSSTHSSGNGTTDGDAYILNVIAVDGTGKLGGGNASDVVTQDYIPMLKNAVKLSDTNNGESDATILGTEYGADCAETGPQTENYGMAITSESDLQEVKIAYTKEDSGSDTAVQVTAFFKGETVIAKVTYSDVYIDSIVYIEVEGTVYSYKLLSEDDLESHGSGTTDTDPILLKTDATVQKRPAQQL